MWIWYPLFPLRLQQWKPHMFNVLRNLHRNAKRISISFKGYLTTRNITKEFIITGGFWFFLLRSYGNGLPTRFPTKKALIWKIVYGIFGITYFIFILNTWLNVIKKFPEQSFFSLFYLLISKDFPSEVSSSSYFKDKPEQHLFLIMKKIFNWIDICF